MGIPEQTGAVVGVKVGGTCVIVGVNVKVGVKE